MQRKSRKTFWKPRIWQPNRDGKPPDGLQAGEAAERAAAMAIGMTPRFRHPAQGLSGSSRRELCPDVLFDRKPVSGMHPPVLAHPLRDQKLIDVVFLVSHEE